MRLSPHFRLSGNNNIGQDGLEGTIDGDAPIYEMQANETRDELRIGGMRYLRPNKIGQSFANATEDDPNSCSVFFINPNETNLLSVENQGHYLHREDKPRSKRFSGYESY